MEMEWSSLSLPCHCDETKGSAASNNCPFNFSLTLVHAQLLTCGWVASKMKWKMVLREVEERNNPRGSLKLD